MNVRNIMSKPLGAAREPSLMAGFGDFSVSQQAKALAVAAVTCAALTSSAAAQSWTERHTRPSLRDLVAVDATGEVIWHYGQDDVARDSFASFAPDEARTDLRSIYAATDGTRLWLRVYVASDAKPSAEEVAFFFADADERSDTGGPAFGAPLYEAWRTDESRGGYEHAFGVRGDGTLVGVFGWNSKEKSWKELPKASSGVEVEIGRDEDPLRIGTRVHGYFQLSIPRSPYDLRASCGESLFVRTFHEGGPERSFGDDVLEAFSCSSRVDAYGDPVAIRSRECTADADCPNDGRCRDGVCLFAYPCEANDECRSNERCADGTCVRVESDGCSSSADCEGLVCVNGTCEPCADDGARACGDSLACSPNGACFDVRNFEPGESTGGADGGLAADAGIVRGGAFHCALTRANARSLFGASLWLAFLALVGRRMTRGRRV